MGGAFTSEYTEQIGIYCHIRVYTLKRGSEEAMVTGGVTSSEYVPVFRTYILSIDVEYFAPTNQVYAMIVTGKSNRG